MKYTISETRQIIAEIEKLGYEPNEWETDFLESIEGQSLSEKQSKCLDKIYEKASGGGIYQRKEYFRR